MCGIYLSISKDRLVEPEKDVLQLLRARGPDSLGRYSITLDIVLDDLQSTATIYLTFVSTVLALRGDVIQAQPLIDDLSGSVLCWNGEAWNYRSHPVRGNDSAYVFNLLLKAASSSPKSSSEAIVQVLTDIAGPYAFVFYDGISRSLYFGRDRLGRRSLMISEGSGDAVLLTSNSTNKAPPLCQEVRTNAVHVIELDAGQLLPKALPWTTPISTINKIDSVREHQSLPTHSSVDQLRSELQQSLSLRTTDVPLWSPNVCLAHEAPVAVLFSGGLDCTLLARMMHDLLPPGAPIDLLNVAFENPRSNRSKPDEAVTYESCPDRRTGRSSLAELLQVCPGRVWRFVTINIPYIEVTQHRSHIIRLMHPHNTEMDLSIAMALYFAARGQGRICSPENPDGTTSYSTPARVLISGLGADELFAGYTRHATAFSRGGYTALADELELDFNRIGQRNLGRDDRVMSYWGKEVRYPYLDETFVAWAIGLPVWEKCGFRHGQTVSKESGPNLNPSRPEDLDPAKLLLRLLAWDLGVRGVANEKKRAIQFGARTAKMEVGKAKAKGTDLVS